VGRRCFAAANDRQGIARLVGRLAGMGRHVAAAVVNPRVVRDFARGAGRLAKTDRLDAYALAFHGERMRPFHGRRGRQPIRRWSAWHQRWPGGPGGAKDSGPMRGKRKSRGDRGQARAVLHMATLMALRFNPVVKAFHQRLIAAGKASKLALTAAMRKLLVMLNAMRRNGKNWQSTAA
jgi:transposase